MDLSADLTDDSEVISKLKLENKQLSDELVRKSQSLVDALRALAEFNRNPVDINRRKEEIQGKLTICVLGIDHSFITIIFCLCGIGHSCITINLFVWLPTYKI